MTVLNYQQVQEVDCYIDNHHEDFLALGKRFFEVFSYDKGSGRISTQVRNLQQIVCSTTRFADIEDFVKNQMGKEGGQGKWTNVGREIMAELRTLRQESLRMDGNEGDRLALRLRLARGWVRAVVGEYLYQIALDQMKVPQ